MPATLLSHQAIVLPLKLKWPRYFSGMALCIGSMAPDFEFIVRMTDDWLFSHLVSAQVWFTVPVTLGLIWLITRLVLPTLLPYVGEIPGMRLHDLAALEAPSTPSQWAGAALSAWIGGMSHLFLDGFTHGNHSGWVVALWPVLRTPVWQLGGAVPLYDALQVWFTVLLGAASLMMWRSIARGRLLWKWRRRNVEPQRIMPRRAGVRLAMIYTVAAMQGALAGYAHHRATGTKNMQAALLFGAIDLMFCTMIVTAIGLRALQSRNAPRRVGFHGRDQTLIST